MRLAAVRAMSASFCDCPAELTVKGGVHIEALAGGWRELASRARALIFLLREFLPDQHMTSAHQQSEPPFARIQSLLAECADGSAPCVMADGTVEIPEIAERRQHRRYPVHWPAVAYSDGGVAQVCIVDVSLGGLCMVVEAVPNDFGAAGVAQVSGTLDIQIPGLGFVAGKITWHTDRNYGVTFDQQLDRDNVLIVAAIAEQQG